MVVCLLLEVLLYLLCCIFLPFRILFVTALLIISLHFIVIFGLMNTYYYYYYYYIIILLVIVFFCISLWQYWCWSHGDLSSMPATTWMTDCWVWLSLVCRTGATWLMHHFAHSWPCILYSWICFDSWIHLAEYIYPSFHLSHFDELFYSSYY